MARIDLSRENGWIPEEVDSTVYREVQANSAIERVARRVPMGSETKMVPLFDGDEPDVLAEGAEYKDAAVQLGSRLLVARKWGKIYPISEEDLADGIVPALDLFKQDWFSKWAVKFDNACLGTTAAPSSAPDGEGEFAVPYESVYRAVGAGVVKTAGALDFDILSNALGTLESGEHFNGELVILADPSTKAAFRNLRDGDGNLVVPGIDAVQSGGIATLFGYSLEFTRGARTSTAATANPAGNPLIVMGPRDGLLNGVRSGPESLVSKEHDFRTDVALLKVRARRGFVVAQPEAFSVIEVTAA